LLSGLQLLVEVDQKTVEEVEYESGHDVEEV
jgi:hypothetical protein